MTARAAECGTPRPPSTQVGRNRGQAIRRDFGFLEHPAVPVVDTVVRDAEDGEAELDVDNRNEGGNVDQVSHERELVPRLLHEPFLVVTILAHHQHLHGLEATAYDALVDEAPEDQRTGHDSQPNHVLIFVEQVVVGLDFVRRRRRIVLWASRLGQCAVEEARLDDLEVGIGQLDDVAGHAASAGVLSFIELAHSLRDAAARAELVSSVMPIRLVVVVGAVELRRTVDQIVHAHRA